jgi:DNA-binding transcriptional regulator YiaG
MRPPISRLPCRNAQPLNRPMAHVIPFTPRSTNPSGLLRAARDRSGLTHAQFAALLGRAIGRPQLGPGTIRAWESGAVSPPIQVLEAAQRLTPQTSAPTVVRQLDGANPPDLGLLITAPPAPFTGPSSIEAVMQAFRDADRQVGGGYVYGAVIRYLEHEIAPQLFCGTSDVFSAAAALTEMAGWMAHDAGDDTLASGHFERALRFASATEDAELAAHIHASHSHLAQHLDRPRDALRFAQAGRSILRRGAHHPALAARLHAMEARALAKLHRRADCARALMNAEKALDRLSSSSPSPWVSPFDRGSLAAEASQCMQQLQQLAAARQHSEQVISLRTSSHARSRAFGQLRLAGILVSQGEIEEACAVSDAALASSDRLSSSRVTQLLHSLHSQLMSHASAPGVEPVVRSLSTALSTRAHTRLLLDAAGNTGT